MRGSVQNGAIVALAGALVVCLLALTERPAEATFPYTVSELGGVIASSHQALTVDATAGGVALPTIPDRAYAAFCSLETAEIRITIDGTAPTTLIGHVKGAGADFTIFGRDALSAFRAIRTGGSSGPLKVTYYAGR